jgi:hypothetical protein
VYVSPGAHPGTLPAPAEANTDEHRATALPPARTVLETEPGTA